MSKQAIISRTVVVLLLFFCGCTSNYNIAVRNESLGQRIVELEKKHNITITVDSSSNQGGVRKLLDRIDEDLDRCPQYFKDNIGPIVIEDSFSEIGLKGAFLIGYVDGADLWDDYPIHIKNRSMLDKILFATPREKDVFLHEASHSFEFNIKAQISDKWDKFNEEFSRVQQRQYNDGALTASAVLPFAGRPASMASLYGSANHFEDFAETHCYLQRNNIELIKDKDPVLYKKCRMVERFTTSGNVSDTQETL